MQNAVIHSTGSYAPEKRVPNSHFDALLGEDVSSWLEENVAIFERRWCADDESVADLAAKAASAAMENGQVSHEEIDLLIVATDTPEYVSPSTASKVQHMLGLNRAGTFDLNTACAGFVTALDNGAKYIRADAHYQTVLVVGAYAMSKYLQMHDKKTVTLFADGAGAVVLKSSNEKDKGWLASQLITRGQYHAHMGIYAGGSKYPVTPERMQNNDHKLKFIEKFPKTLNPEMWTMMAHTLCERIGCAPSDVDKYFLTQININSIRETMDRLGVPHEKAPTIMHQFGYTGSACIPMALDQSMQKGQIRHGDLLLMIGSGGGLAFAGAAFRM